jgi:hypothetical protein
LKKKTIGPDGCKTCIDNAEKRRIDGNNQFMNRLKETQKYIYNFIDLQSFNASLQCSMRQQMSVLEENMCHTENTVTQQQYEEIKITIYMILQTRFPDILIQTDPLKSYILIDWSYNLSQTIL